MEARGPHLGLRCVGLIRVQLISTVHGDVFGLQKDADQAGLDTRCLPARNKPSHSMCVARPCCACCTAVPAWRPVHRQYGCTQERKQASL